MFLVDFVYFETNATAPYQIRRLDELVMVLLRLISLQFSSFFAVDEISFSFQTPNGVEAKVTCYFRRRDISNTLIQQAEKYCEWNQSEDSGPIAFAPTFSAHSELALSYTFDSKIRFAIVPFHFFNWARDCGYAMALFVLQISKKRMMLAERQRLRYRISCAIKSSIGSFSIPGQLNLYPPPISVVCSFHALVKKAVMWPFRWCFVRSSIWISALTNQSVQPIEHWQVRLPGEVAVTERKLRLVTFCNLEFFSHVFSVFIASFFYESLP